MKSWLARTFGRSDAKPGDPLANADLHCSFCGKHRREVHKLVAGPSVYICDGCIALSAQIVDSEDPTGTYYALLIVGQLAEVARDTRHAVVTPRLRGAIELAAGSPTLLRRISRVAERFEERTTALAALAAIPIDQRTSGDRLDVAMLLFDDDRHVEALATLDTIDAAPLTGQHRVLYRLHRAIAELGRGDATRGQLAAHRTMALELQAEVDALHVSSLHGEHLTVLVLAQLGLGELADAEVAARARIERQPDNPSARETLARVLDARGDRAGATTARAEALERAHPDGLLARKLRAAGASGPFR